MKEYTFVMTAKLTAIIEGFDDSKPLPKEKIAENVTEVLLNSNNILDDVVISDVQMFERDID